MKKKRAVLVSFLFAVFAVAVPNSFAAETGKGADNIVGAWRGKVQFTSGAFAETKDLEFMYAFNVGGTMSESSNYDGAPPVPPAYGVWRKTESGEYELKYEYYSTTPAEEPAFLKGAGWPPSGRGVFTETIKLAADGKSFTSAMRYEAFDAKGNPAEGGGTAKGQAIRIGF